MDTSAQERRRWILTCSARLFANKGIASTTVRDIGDAAGVLSGSLYHYFQSKDNLVSVVLGEFITDVQRRFASVEQESTSPGATVRGLILETIRIIDDHPHSTAIYQNDRQYLRDHALLDPVDSGSRAVRGYWLRAIEAGIHEGTFRSDIPPMIIYRSVRDTLWATTHWPDRKGHSVTEFADFMIAFFFTGFLASSRHDQPELGAHTGEG